MAAAQALGGVNAIFAHLDIVGAEFNHKQQAVRGLTPETFPAQVPVFTGHYHKPQTVADGGITYLGSPFQRALPQILSSSPCAVCQGEHGA